MLLVLGAFGGVWFIGGDDGDDGTYLATASQNAEAHVSQQATSPHPHTL